MNYRLVFIERKFLGFVSIEKVFEQISKSISSPKLNISFVKLLYGNNISGIIKNLIFFKKPKADIFHITGHIHYIALLLPKNKTVLTIHDLRILYTRKGLRRFILKKLMLDIPVRKLKYITTISEFTKSEILRFTDCDENKIRVIENPLLVSSDQPQKKDFNDKCPTILQIGTSENKNLNNLIEAIKDICCKLEIVGHLNSDQLNLLEKYKINFNNSFDLDDFEMLEKYQQTDLVAFCSSYEGFGLPIIESQALKTPVISSRISPLKEVAGEGAVLVDPSNPNEIKEGILKIISDENFRNKLIKEGIENIKRFEPKKIAMKYQVLYEEILNENL